MTLQETVRACSAATEQARYAPWQGHILSAWQLQWLQSQERTLLLRGGNAIGKSWVAALAIVLCARGFSPYTALRPPPVDVLVVGYSFTQMDPLIRKIWAMLPKDEIDPALYYQRGNGIKGHKNPVVEFVAGPAKGSAITFYTYEQGAGNVMGWQGDYVFLDEPPPEAVWGEIQPRVNERRGFVRVLFTPTPESPPLGYMKQLVKSGAVVEQNVIYQQESMTLTCGAPFPLVLKAQWEIDADIQRYLPDEREMRRTGAWEAVAGGRWFWAVDRATHLWRGRRALDLPKARWKLSIGIDHGTNMGRQAMVLLAVNAENEVCYVLDEVAAEERTTTREDARLLLAMLARQGLTWGAIDYWTGDRRHGGDQFSSEKSNTDLLRALADELGVKATWLQQQGLRIHTARKGPGSVRRDVTALNDLARRRLLHIAEQAAAVWRCILEWEGAEDDPRKDHGDALRYALRRAHDELKRGEAGPLGRYEQV